MNSPSIHIYPPHLFIVGCPPHLFITGCPPHLFIVGCPPHLFITACPPHLFIVGCPPHLCIIGFPPHLFIVGCPPHLFIAGCPPWPFNCKLGGVKGGRTPPTQFFCDGCYARLLLLYTYRSFSTATQGQSTCRKSRSLILERTWKKYRGLVIKLCSSFLERCGKLELRNLVYY